MSCIYGTIFRRGRLLGGKCEWIILYTLHSDGIGHKLDNVRRSIGIQRIKQRKCVKTRCPRKPWVDTVLIHLYIQAALDFTRIRSGIGIWNMWLGKMDDASCGSLKNLFEVGRCQSKEMPSGC